MSAILVFNQSDKISLLTDAAHYTVTGDLVAAAPKCYALPHLNYTHNTGVVEFSVPPACCQRLASFTRRSWMSRAATT